jgi:hypothetical protein
MNIVELLEVFSGYAVADLRYAVNAGNKDNSLNTFRVRE